MLLSSRLRGLRALVDGLVGPTRASSVLSFRVQPWDIDLNVHLTNGRFPQLMDVGRIHHLTASGIGRALYQRGLRPVAVEVHLAFRRELKLGQAFTLHTEIVGRSRKALVFTQRFMVGEVEHAVGTVHVVLVGTGGVVDPDVLGALLPEAGRSDQVQGSSARADQ